MYGGDWSDDDALVLDSESEEDGDLVVNELVLKSSDIYLVKDHTFHWKVDEKLKKEKQYQTDITLCWNTNDDVRLPQGSRRKKPRLLQNLEKNFNLTFPLAMKWSAAMSLQRSFWKQYSDYCISFKVNTADKFFQKLQRLVINPTLIVELKIDKLTDSIEIRLDDDVHDVVEVFKRDFCRLSNKKLHKGENIDGSFSVKLKGEENKYAEPYKGFNLAEKLWKQKADDADCTIVVANGVEIKCHQLILKLHSPVFRSMFESGMSETMTRRVNIKDMTEEAMVAILKFLYTWDLELPMRNMSVASRLLQAGHRYEIKNLEQAMTQLFGAKRSPDDYKEWAASTTVEEILDTYVFAHNVGSDLKDVETTCVKMLKIRTTELEKSEQFKDMFRTKQEIAAKLCLAFAKLSGK
ncbi:Kelch repeat and BTB domain-containing protein 12 [Orchesella cincta]|uniref:Kelch repeat and BTB domain-containing protein 12 n=1 Tax=Orchesella cincta TaxID=48709 RepID=A0A1D2N4L1_ORCCI|nr:Kelch repeat and BTB domain-containing protein 12 [Orchesella cincta]